MTPNIFTHTRKIAAITLLTFTTITASAQTTATWTGGGGDGDWNNAANWDIGVPAEGTNAFIGSGNNVSYNSPMAASSFARLTDFSSTLNINASGFSIDGSGNGAATFFGSAARLYINNGGVVNMLNGGLTLTTNAAGEVLAGGKLAVAGNLYVGAGGSSGGGGGAGILTNSGGVITAGAVAVNASSGNPQNCLFYINGGSNSLGAVSVGRSSAGSGGFLALGTEGLHITGGLVNMTSLDVGASGGNSFLTARMTGGIVTNTGDFIVRQLTASRASRFLQTGGLLVCSGANGVNLRGNASANTIVIYSVTGGTNLVQGFALGTPGGTDTTGTIRLTNAAKIYVGSAGITSSGTLNTKTIALNSGGVFGAQADWSCTEPILLAGGTFDCADLDGTPHNITLSGVLSGAGALNKSGGGTLTLEAANTYSGNTLVNAGTLALGASGTIANSPQIIVAAGAAFDASAPGGYTVAASRTLGGSGTVTGNVAVASGGIVSPGTASPGTLTLVDSLTMTGDGVIRFDLPTTPGPGNDLLVVGGNLNISGVNTLEIVGGGSPGTVHTLIQYGGNFNGTVGNFTISGANGVLSNNPTTKTISLIIQSATRSPTNVVWVGNASVNDWDTVNSTNWLNTGTGLLDYFVTGDNARFDETGAANPIVNLVGNNSPASVTVDAAANYTFGGSGAIAGSGGLLKTNSGTLTVSNTNTYTGPTVIGGGVLQVATLANGGSPSSIGAPTADPGNLVFNGGTLRYTGGSVATDRGATFAEAGGTIDVTNAAAVLTVNGTVTGVGQLIKSGAGTLTLTAANNYSGGTIINGGTLRVNVAGAAGSGPITNNASKLLVGGAITLGNVMHFTGTCTVDLNNAGGNTALDGAWSGDGTVNIINQQNSTRIFTVGGNGSGGGHMWDFSGTINMGTNDGTLRFNDGGGSFNLGSSNAIFNLGTGTAILRGRNGGVTIHLGALLGGPNTRVLGRSSDGGDITYSIGGKNMSTTFEGRIEDTSSSVRTAIIKVGTGNWTLTGNSTYTGNTRVESGVLQVDGSLGNTEVTVAGGTLAGNGSIGGSVTIQSEGTLSPGSSVGTLRINNNLTIEGNLLFEVDKSLAQSNDIVQVGGYVYNGGSGTLTVTNLGPALAVGDTFYLFDKAVTGGSSLTVTGCGVTWTNNLENDGSISVLAVPEPARPKITSFFRSGTNLVLAGTNGPFPGNYYVLASTNVALPVTNWTRIATNPFGPGGSFACTNPISPTVPQRFYLIQVTP